MLLHLVGCLYYLYQWCTVKQISNSEVFCICCPTNYVNFHNSYVGLHSYTSAYSNFIFPDTNNKYVILQTHIIYLYPNYLARNCINVSPSSAVTGTRNKNTAMISLNINILSILEKVSNLFVYRMALLSIPRLNKHFIIIPIFT